MLRADVLDKLKKIVGDRAVLHAPHDLMLYEYDGSVDKSAPDGVVLPTNTRQVVSIVKLAKEHDLRLVGRGAGTGLSGGAIAREGGIMIGFARMNRILELDLENERAVVDARAQMYGRRKLHPVDGSGEGEHGHRQSQRHRTDSP